VVVGGGGGNGSRKWRSPAADCCRMPFYLKWSAFLYVWGVGTAGDKGTEAGVAFDVTDKI
jgi:hypothetical protein